MENEIKVPSFDSVYRLLRKIGGFKIETDGGKKYTVSAEQGNIVLHNNSGRLTVHEDCWGQEKTCKGEKVGFLYCGSCSIIEWYNEQLKTSVNRK